MEKFLWSKKNLVANNVLKTREHCKDVWFWKQPNYEDDLCLLRFF